MPFDGGPEIRYTRHSLTLGGQDDGLGSVRGRRRVGNDDKQRITAHFDNVYCCRTGRDHNRLAAVNPLPVQNRLIRLINYSSVFARRKIGISDRISIQPRKAQGFYIKVERSQRIARQKDRLAASGR